MPTILPFFFHQAVNQLSAGDHRALRLGLAGKPLVQRGADDRVRLRHILSEAVVAVVDGRGAFVAEQHDLLAHDLALQRSPQIHAGFQQLQGVGVQTSAADVLGARAIASLQQQNAFALFREGVSAGAAGRACAYYDCVKTIVRHRLPQFLSAAVNSGSTSYRSPTMP